MNKQNKFIPIVFRICFALSLLPGWTWAQKPPTNKELKIGITQEFESLNPLILSMSASAFMYRLMGRTLVVLNHKGQWVPQLAKEIPSLEKGTAKIINDKGQKKIIATWEILEAAKWSDGKPVICDDFALSLKIASSPNVSIAEKESFTQVEKIESLANNPKLCQFTYAKVKWDFYQLGNFAPVPKHIEEPIFKKFANRKEGYEKNSAFVKTPTLPGISNGPYVVAELKLGSHVTFTPNPYFYGPAPKIQKIVVKLIPNTGTLEANLRSGTIDMISPLGFDLDQAIAFEKKVKAENLPYVVLFEPSLTYEHIDVDLNHPILKDIQVRRALLHAVDMKSLTQSLFEGRQQVAIHSLSPKDPWFTQDPKVVKVYNYSKRTANKLLEEAGWILGSNGIRQKQGQKLSFNFMTTAGNKTREKVQAYLQNQWKQVGVEVIIKNEPARVFFGETTRKRKYNGLALFAWVSSPESTPRSTFASASIPTEKNGWSGQNYTGWSHPDVDRWIDQLELEFNPQNRLKIIHQIVQKYTEELPALPLYYRSDIAVLPKNLKNYQPTGHQYYETNQAELWTLQ